MFSTCSELTPRAPIPDGRMEQTMQPWSCNASSAKYRKKHGISSILRCEQCKIPSKAWNMCNVLYLSSVRYKTKHVQCAKCCHTILLSPLRCQSASVVQREDYTKLHSDARISQNSSETVAS